MKLRISALVATTALCLAVNSKTKAADSLRVEIQGGIPPIITSNTLGTTGSTLQLNSTVYPVTQSQSVTWTVISNTATGSVNSSGLVSANAQTSGYIWVKARSVADTTKTDSVKILVYCKPSHTNPINWFLIDTVRIPGTTLYHGTNTTGNAGAYTQLPASGTSTATLLKGDTYTIRTQVTSVPGPFHPDTTMNTYSLSGWLDFNGNGIFEQSEWLDINDSALNRFSTYTFTVPTTAVTGYVMLRLRSRVQGSSNGVGDMCLGFNGSGQTEDYLVTLAEPPSCNGEPGKTPGDKGCVKFTYAGKTVIYPTVRGKDGNVWIQKNLGADQVADSAAHVAAFGDVFQWGRWDDGHQFRNSTTSTTVPSPNDPSGLGGGSNVFYTTSPAWWNVQALTDKWHAAKAADVTDTNGCDPCKALGAGWHMPSVADWQYIISSESITSPATAASSNLKLAVGGVRSSSGTYNFVGQRGYYWSNEPSSTGAKHLYYSSAITNPTAGGPRAQGASVRCLKSFRVDSVKVSVANNGLPQIATDKGTLQMQSNVFPYMVNQDVKWSIVPATGSATINNTGLVTAQRNGTVWAKAVSIEDTTKADSLQITISAQIIPIDSVRMGTAGNVPAAITTLSGTLQMTSQVYPLNAHQQVTWTWNNVTGTATVSTGGLVTASSNGTVLVKVKSVQDTTMSDSMVVTITGQPIPVDSVRIRTRGNVPAQITTPNGTLQLDANVYPTGTGQNVIWSLRAMHGNATVNANGLVTATVDAIVLVKATSVQDSKHADSILINITGQTTGVDIIDADYGLAIYPNPAQNYIYVSAIAPHPALEIALYDVDGRRYKSWQMHENSLTQPVQLNVADVPTGIYILKISGDQIQKTLLMNIKS